MIEAVGVEYTEPLVQLLLPHPDLEDFWNLTSWLSYQRAPGGSGFCYTRADVMDMEFAEIAYRKDFLFRAWKAENEARRKEAR